MTENTSPDEKRTCEWCGESISSQVVKCPHCKKWRKDLANLRVPFYCWSGLAVFPFLLLYSGIIKGWWTQAETLSIYKFSIKIFFTSFPGIVVTIGFIITSTMWWRYYAKISRKIGSWSWF